MAVLAIDTSAAVAVSLCDDDGALLAARSVDSARQHAELLAPMIRDVLAEAGLTAGDVSAVVVGTGPAPFTGLRAGLVTARVFALARSIPLYGVPSLDALAAEALTSGEFVSPAPVRESTPTNSRTSHELGGAAAGVEVVAVGDARRREVYAARYRGVGAAGAADDRGAAVPATGADGGDLEVELVAGPVVEHPDELAELVRGAVVVGRGAQAYPEAFPGARAPFVPDPAVLARLAISRARRGVEQPSEPLYLRRPDAVPASARKRATG